MEFLKLTKPVSKLKSIISTMNIINGLIMDRNCHQVCDNEFSSHFNLDTGSSLLSHLSTPSMVMNWIKLTGEMLYWSVLPRMQTLDFFRIFM